MKRSDHDIVQEVLDGNVSKEAFEDFQERLRSDEELLELYGEYAAVHHSLQEEFEDESPRGMRMHSHARARKWLFGAVAAAVIAGLGLTTYYTSYYRGVILGNRGGGMIGTIRFSPDAVWQVEGSSRMDKETARIGKGGTLHLGKGRANVAVGDTASVLLQGPASLTVVSGEVIHLAAGQGRFRNGRSDGKLKVTTPTMTAEDLGTEFGVRVAKDLPDEIHVFEGKVRMRNNGGSKGEILSAGEAGRVSGSQSIEKFAASGTGFAKQIGVFRTIVGDPVVKTDWRVEYGTPSFQEGGVDGENYAAFMKLPEPVPVGADHVMLATLRVGTPSSGEFHTEGWAGLSFFSGGVELLFFGDSYGPEKTWSLDVKQRMPVILPGNPVMGPHTVTLRYDRDSGEVSLHEGRGPLSPAFCSSRLPPGTTFDEIRIGASANAALAAGAIHIQVGGGDP